MLLSCSLPPERPFTRQDIFKTNIYNHFSIKESPDSVVAAVNRDGEAVVEGTDKAKKAYYIKIIATGKTLKTTYIER
jgi:hypothetical protein